MAWTSRERVEAAMHRQVPDRVPIDYGANPGIQGRLMRALGLRPDDEEGLLRALRVDFRSTYADYVGKPLFICERADRRIDPLYGYVMRWAEHADGGYWDFCDFPLKDAPAEKIASYPLPSADDFDYEASAARARTYARQGYAVRLGHAGMADLINTLGRVMGMEDALVNLACEDEATLHYVDRMYDWELAMMERQLERSKDDIAVFMWGEDLGTQHSPMISMDMYRRVLKPRHQRFIDLAKAYGKPVMVHSCGSSSWVYPQWIEMGVDVVDTLQPEAKNMSPKYLKQTFGDCLAFHGCLSTAGPLAFGSEKEVRQTVRELLDIMMPGGGYLFAPTHSIQDNSPVANVLSAYEEAFSYGTYGG